MQVYRVSNNKASNKYLTHISEKKCWLKQGEGKKFFPLMVSRKSKI